MNYPWLEKYLLAKTGVTNDYKMEWGWQRYMVGGKLFAAIMHPSGEHAPAYAEKDLLNLKCDPMFSQLLRAEYREIMPGFYADKRTWISVDLGGELPDELLEKLIDDSYALVFEKLTQKLQREILESATAINSDRL
ncbi:MAG: MmcQ/YjbR family DNA-binding protein [Oscillibacter sp.]|jgi:predicted DNA-binding protein (MmcQ/YjbR family)|nr:MmcQ/YjbR family DNA-binding protein [Oscillibacter sp.]